MSGYRDEGNYGDDKNFTVWDTVNGFEGRPLEGADDDHEHDTNKGCHGDLHQNFRTEDN